MSLRRLVFVLVILSASSVALSETVLLPVVVNQVIPGAFGSQWVSRLTVANTGAAPLTLHDAKQICSLADCVNPSDVTIPGGQTILSYPLWTTMEVPGKFIRVDGGRLGDLAVNLRAQDLSRQGSTWGTEMPVVAERMAATDKIDLLNVPVTGDFRALVRIYDFDPAEGHTVIARIYRPAPVGSTSPDPLFQEMRLPLKVPSDRTQYPGYAEINMTSLGIVNDPSLPPGATAVVRVEIVPQTPGLRFYAFASVTNNASQHVTVIRP